MRWFREGGSTPLPLTSVGEGKGGIMSPDDFSVRTRVAVVLTLCTMVVLLFLTVVPALGLDATTHYTGCLKATGTMINIAVGDTPKKPCGALTEVHFSGGDVTSVNTPTGSGLAGGATDGDVTLSLQDSYKLPQTCSSGQVAKWDGTMLEWGCASDNDTQAPNLQQIAILKWFGAGKAASFSVGSSPFGVAFDGADVWVTNSSNNNVSKLRASDGATLGTFSVGSSPVGVAFDGADVWVTNNGSNNVSKLRASDRATLGTFSVGSTPFGVAFDGANVWVTNQGSNNVSKLRASDGATLGTFSVGSSPVGVAFDGANVWVTNQSSNNVSKLRASDGASLGTFPVGDNPLGVAFDGANVWVANQFSGTVSKL